MPDNTSLAPSQSPSGTISPQPAAIPNNPIPVTPPGPTVMPPTNSPPPITPPSPPFPQNTPPPAAPPSTLGSKTPPPPKAPIKKSPFRFVGPLLIILVVVGLGFFLYSKIVANRQAKPPENITLTYWGLWEPNQAIQSVFTAFESQFTGVKVNYVQQSHKEYRERLQAAIQRGEGPDVFRYHNTWVPMLKNELASIPKSVMSASEFEKTFYPITQKDLMLSGNYVGIPLEFDGLALYYNQTIFKNANKTPPTTWEELRQLASSLTLRDEENRIIRGGAALGTTNNVDHWSDILALMMLQNAANPANPQGELAEDSLAFYTIFKKTDLVWDETMPPSTVAFANEKVAMMIAPSWRAFDIKNLNPNLQFATVPVPQLPNTSVYWASYWVEGVSKKTTTDKQQLAWDLLNFLSQPENLRIFYNQAKDLRLFGEPYSRVDMASELENDPIVGAYLSTAKNAQSWWLSGWTHDNGLNDRIIKYYEDAVNAISLQGSSPKRALETTSEGVVQVLSQFGVSGALR